MTLLQIITAVLAITLSVGGVIAALGYSYGKFQEGRAKQKKEGIDTESALLTNLREQIQAFEGLVNGLKKENKELNERFIGLEATMREKENSWKAIMEEKDKTIKQYLDILKDRNPETEVFMRNMVAEAAAAASHRDSQMAIFSEIRDSLKGVSDHLTKGFRVESVVTPDGHKGV